MGRSLSLGRPVDSPEDRIKAPPLSRHASVLITGLHVMKPGSILDRGVDQASGGLLQLQHLRIWANIKSVVTNGMKSDS